MATIIWSLLEALSALLPAQSGEPQSCPAFALVVCAEPSGRGFCRNLCGVAAATLPLAHALCGLAGAQEARICRRADERNRRHKAGIDASREGRAAVETHPDAW